MSRGRKRGAADGVDAKLKFEPGSLAYGRYGADVCRFAYLVGRLAASYPKSKLSKTVLDPLDENVIGEDARDPDDELERAQHETAALIAQIKPAEQALFFKTLSAYITDGHQGALVDEERYYLLHVLEHHFEKSLAVDIQLVRNRIVNLCDFRQGDDWLRKECKALGYKMPRKGRPKN